jgi:methylenetetrahydrofolate dehydrogenase (NADP+)/methenyltetrahydrofolate cyclohydrolase
MPAHLLDGNRMATDVRTSLRPRIDAFRARVRRPPGLAIVLVGANPASEIYVRNKLKAAADLGMRADLERLPETATLADLLSLIQRLNGDPAIDGLLVQAPLPAGMGPGAATRVMLALDPAKDVDGFHPLNVGHLVQNRGRLVACTPRGVIDMLDRGGIAIARRHAVVIGRSDIVGKPMALLLLHRDATVTICHSKTPDLPRMAAEADILVAAIGRPAFVTKAFVKPGATVVDVGINRVADLETFTSIFGADSSRRADFDRRGGIVVGDVHPSVAEVAAALTPVPGGVGPMTIAMLLANTVTAAETAFGDLGSS